VAKDANASGDGPPFSLYEFVIPEREAREIQQQGKLPESRLARACTRAPE
jgi:hypothetical protein